jgi:hypothetical protein
MVRQESGSGGSSRGAIETLGSEIERVKISDSEDGEETQWIGSTVMAGMLTRPGAPGAAGGESPQGAAFRHGLERPRGSSSCACGGFADSSAVLPAQQHEPASRQPMHRQ